MKRRIKKILNSIKTNNPKRNLCTEATWLPVFTGYYHSIFDCSDSVIEYEAELTEDEYKEYYPELAKEGVTYSFFQQNLWEFLDFSEAYKEASESICYAILKLDHANIIKDVQFEKLVSPKYYNFSSDSINCEITFNSKKLKQYLSKNKEAFKQYIESKYTSRDGFSSWHSNDVDEWMKPEMWGSHGAGSVLNFVIINEYGSEHKAEMDLYEESNCSEDFHNFRELKTEEMIKRFKKEIAA